MKQPHYPGNDSSGGYESMLDAVADAMGMTANEFCELAQESAVDPRALQQRMWNTGRGHATAQGDTLSRPRQTQFSIYGSGRQPRRTSEDIKLIYGIGRPSPVPRRRASENPYHETMLRISGHRQTTILPHIRLQYGIPQP